MKNILCTITLLLATTLAQAQPQPASPFTMNGWQLHEYNMPKLEEAVKRAPEYGVNFLIFSHGFFWSPEGFLASSDDLDPRNPPAYLNELRLGDEFQLNRGWHGDMRKIAAMAAERKIPYYIWLHEFNDMPKRFLKPGPGPNDRPVLNMDDPGVFPFLEDRYNRLLKIVPDCAGFVLTFHESDFRIFRNTQVVSRHDVPERIYRVSQFFYDFLKKRDKQLIVRNFFYEPLEMEYYRKALDRLPDDVICMMKDTTHEFHPFYPWDPQHGRVGNKRQIIEIDLGVEKAWSSRGAYAQTDYIRRVAQRAREKQMNGLVGRARFLWDDSFADAHEVNLYAFSRFLQNPDLGVDQVLQDWAAKRFPAGAVPHVASAMKRSEFIQHHGRWHLEYWLTKSIGSEWGDYPYYFSRVFTRSRYKWSKDPADQALEEKLYHPDRATFDKLIAEKDEVVRQVRAGQNDLRQAGRYVTADKLEALDEDFRWLYDAAMLQREWVRAYFAMRMYMDDPKPEFRQTVDNALARLEQIERTPGVTYGLSPDTGRRYNIEAFVLEMRWRTANRDRALAEDARILEEARRVADVANQ